MTVTGGTVLFIITAEPRCARSGEGRGERERGRYLYAVCATVTLRYPPSTGTHLAVRQVHLLCELGGEEAQHHLRRAAVGHGVPAQPREERGELAPAQDVPYGGEGSTNKGEHASSVCTRG